MFSRMRVLNLLVILTLCNGALAQRPANVTICDYYSEKILGEKTAASQKLLLTILINTVVVGNYTTPNVGVSVHGIATPGVQDGKDINLLPYFTGALLSTTPPGDGDVGVSKLFLDDGGAAALQMNMSSVGATSAQHFMDISKAENNFFIQQLVDASSSIGFSKADAENWRTLMAPFNTRCAPAFEVEGVAGGAYLQSVCANDDCPLDKSANCDAYPAKGVAFAPANATMADASPSASGSANPSAPGAVNGSASATPTSMAVGMEHGFGLQILVTLFAAGLVAFFQV
ncbi:hypothetical protein BKA65DRAFT_536556 [Rhexocercosporidium sp. MPI-PUGE-AT-0058]|nr:hypothetical protein BKA65DRAFT_536556 [Rhexocercosporidium sp. MPI-PUGE-AT-0058]